MTLTLNIGRTKLGIIAFVAVLKRGDGAPRTFALRLW